MRRSGSNPVNWIIKKSMEATLNHSSQLKIQTSLSQQDPYHRGQDLTGKKRSKGFIVGESEVGEDNV